MDECRELAGECGGPCQGPDLLSHREKADEGGGRVRGGPGGPGDQGLEGAAAGVEKRHPFRARRGGLVWTRGVRRRRHENKVEPRRFMHDYMCGGDCGFCIGNKEGGGLIRMRPSNQLSVRV